MNILIDQAVYDQRNIGNVALLQTAVDRLAELMPDAKIQVLTEAPYSLKLYCPNVHPVSVFPFRNWSDERKQYLHTILPGWAIRILLELRENMRSYSKKLAKNGSNRKTVENSLPEHDIQDRAENVGNEHSPTNTDISRAINSADLFVASGGGYMVNADDPSCLYTVLDRLEQGIHRNKKVVMVGQGVDQLKNPILVQKARQVLPRIDYIFIREKVLAPQVLKDLGVSPDHIIMTGDDAVEMAYAARGHKMGNQIGVNLRVAIYTNFRIVDHLRLLRSVLHECASRYNARLVAVPISHSPLEMDVEYIRSLLAGYPRTYIPRLKYESPIDLIRRIGGCRVVVTGAFHPAVFALSQGIPVVGIIKSKEYYKKFNGLLDEFGPACQIIDLNNPDLKENLSQAIIHAWEKAEEYRPALLKVAQRQISMGRDAYHKIRDLALQDG